MGKPKRLNQAEAISLGLEPKKEPGRNTAVYYLNDSRLQAYEKLKSDSDSVPNEYDSQKKALSAWDYKENRLLSPKEWSEKHGLEYKDGSSYKFIPYHYGEPTYHLVDREKVDQEIIDIEEVKKIIRSELKQKFRPRLTLSENRAGVVKIADLHLGAKIKELLRTRNFDLKELRRMLSEAASIINRFNYSAVHVHFLGDLIESFTGLNHKNSWKSLDPNLIGAEAVMTCVKVLEEDFLNHIKNLDQVKIVAGNHDRTTSDSKEDTKGDAAKLIAWGLKLRGFDVEFNAKVLTHLVGNIAHILSHGHLGMTKKLESMIWDHGIQGKFNLVCYGHLHSVIKKLSIKQREKFDIVSQDAVDRRQMYCLSLFPGNDFSEDLGFTSAPGFHIIEDNGRGLPHVFDFSL